MTEIENIIGTYMFPGKIKIVIENVDGNNVKVVIDRGNVDFNVANMPDDWGNHNSDKYDGIPIIHDATFEMTKNDFFISRWNKSYCYLENGGIYSVETAVNILDAFKLVIDALVKDNYIKVETFDRNGATKLMDDDGMLPAEVSRYGWNLKRACALQDDTIKSNKALIGTVPCALCIKYDNHGTSCFNCPLHCIGENCYKAESAYYKCERSASNEEFIKACDEMIKVLGDAVIYERTRNNELKDTKLIGEHKFAGGIKVNIDENHGVYKLDFDPGTVDFRPYHTPYKYGSSTHESYYHGIPVIFSCGDTKYYINFDGNDNGGGNFIQFPLYTTEDYCEKFLKGVKLVVDKFIKMGYIKEENSIPMEYSFGDIKIKLNNTSCPGMVTFTLDGMKSRSHLPEKYINGYPMCYMNANAVVLKCSNGKYIREDATYSDYIYYLFTTDTLCTHKIEISTALKIVEEIKICVDRLRKINNEEYKNKSIKLMSREEMLELLDKGELLPSEICKKKYEMLREYCIVNNICNSHDIRQNMCDTCALCETNLSKSDCTKCPLHKIGQDCGANGTAFRDFIDYDGDAGGFIETIDNMIKTLDQAIEYEKNKLKVEVYNIGKMTITLTPIDCNKVKLEIDGMKCHIELPEKYHCSVNPRCYKYINGLVSMTDGYKWLLDDDNPNNIIKSRKDAMEIIDCMKICSQILHDINEPKEEITKIGTVTLKSHKISDDVYECSIEGMKNYDELPKSYGENRSIAKCLAFIDDDFVVYDTMHNPFIFSQAETQYSKDYPKIDNFKVTTAELEKLKTLLKQASDNLHNINKPKYEFVEVPDYRTVFDMSGVKITCKPVGELYKISIDSNGYDLTGGHLNGVDIIIPDPIDEFYTWFWISINNKCDWFMRGIQSHMPIEDKDKFYDNTWDNGIELTKQGAKILINCLKQYFEQLSKDGNLKRTQD